MATSSLPSIPQYMREHVDNKLDLDEKSSCPCPFHKEKHGKSFSIKGIQWRCWGQCQKGGDIVDLHQFNYGIKDRDEAKRSLCNLYHISISKETTFERKAVEADETQVRRKFLYNKALRCANGPDSWVELDYILSKVPYDVAELELFCSKLEPR